MGALGQLKTKWRRMNIQALISLSQNRVIHVLMLGLILMMNSSCYGRIDDQTKKSRAIVEKSAIWFIEEGVAEYYENKDVNLIRKNIQELGGFVPTTEIVLVDDTVLAKILVDHFWMRSVATCYARVQSDLVYEYWTIEINSSREEPRRAIYFLITKSDGIDKKRDIIHRTKKFFPEYTAPDGTIIRFPLDNDEALYDLNISYYSDGFKGTILEGVEYDNETGKFMKNGKEFKPGSLAGTAHQKN